MKTAAIAFAAWAGAVALILRFMHVATAGDVDEFPQTAQG